MSEDHEYLPTFQQVELFMTNGRLKPCTEEKQEECKYYKPKESKPGHVDLTCLYWRTDLLGKDSPVCDAPPPEKK